MLHCGHSTKGQMTESKYKTYIDVSFHNELNTRNNVLRKSPSLGLKREGHPSLCPTDYFVIIFLGRTDKGVRMKTWHGIQI